LNNGCFCYVSIKNLQYSLRKTGRIPQCEKDSSEGVPLEELQPELGITAIEDIIIPTKSRDELPPVLMALQY